MTAFIAGVVAGIGTYLSRAGFIVVLARRRIPDSVVVSLQFVAPAVLGSLVVALLITEDGQVAIGWAEIAALTVGGVVAHRTRNHIFTLVAGMGMFWIVRALA